jgi:hypothetical protein
VIEPEVEQFLGRLERALHGLRRRERERALREAQDHVLCAADERESSGSERAASLRSAIAAFGAVESVAAGYARPDRQRPGPDADPHEPCRRRRVRGALERRARCHGLPARLGLDPSPGLRGGAAGRQPRTGLLPGHARRPLACDRSGRRFAVGVGKLPRATADPPVRRCEDGRIGRRIG